MPPLPETAVESKTVLAIYAAYERRVEHQRRYLGASQIGKPCSRSLWYSFRWAGRETFSGRMIRLFETGQAEEIRMVANLRQIGCEVMEVDPATGEQFSVSAIGGHFGGHMDGVAVGLPESPKAWHVCEFKTHNIKSFASLKSKGVKEAKPEHFAQMQVYMHLSQGIDRALYLAVCKDTDELYSERIRYDYGEASRIMGRAREIITAAEPPARPFPDRDYFQCRFCSHRDRCWGDEAGPAVPVDVTCRSCCHATPVVEGDAGQWVCERKAKALSEVDQAKACTDHIFIPLLVNGAKPVDGDADAGWVEYQTDDGRTFRNGPGYFASSELAAVPLAGIGSNPVVDHFKAAGATVVDAATLEIQRTPADAAKPAAITQQATGSLF